MMSCEGGKCRTSKRDNVAIACKAHWVALELTSFNHRGFCEECCDLPSLMRSLEEWGLRIVKHGIKHMRQRDAAYWRRLLAILETGDLPVPG